MRLRDQLVPCFLLFCPVFAVFVFSLCVWFKQLPVARRSRHGRSCFIPPRSSLLFLLVFPVIFQPCSPRSRHAPRALLRAPRSRGWRVRSRTERGPASPSWARGRGTQYFPGKAPRWLLEPNWVRFYPSGVVLRCLSGSSPAGEAAICRSLPAGAVVTPSK